MRSVMTVLNEESTARWLGIDELARRTYGTRSVTKAQRVAVGRAIQRLDEMGLAVVDKAWGDSYPPRTAVREPGRGRSTDYVTLEAERPAREAGGLLDALDDPERVPAVLKRVETVLGARASSILQMYVRGLNVDEIAVELGVFRGVVDGELRTVLAVLGRM